MDSILVIDDERPILNMFGMLLEFYGFRPLTAEGGAEGLAIFEKERPKAVFVDVKMPGMDGLEVLQRIKALDPDTEVILITGHGDKELARRAYSLNADDFINKPFQQESLDDAIQRLQQRFSGTR